MGIFRRIRDWYSNLHKKPAEFSIRCDETGLVQTVKREDGQKVTQLKWDQVTSVYAYKRDLFAYDQICFLIECADFRIEVREGDEGYESLIAQMHHHIPGFPAEKQWWDTVALPPFAPNWTEIYRRKKGNAEDLQPNG